MLCSEPVLPCPDYPEHVRHCIWRDIINCLCAESCSKLWTCDKPWDCQTGSELIPGQAHLSVHLLGSRAVPTSRDPYAADTLGGNCAEINNTAQALTVQVRVSAGGCNENFTEYDADQLVGQAEMEIMRLLCQCQTEGVESLRAMTLTGTEYRYGAQSKPAGIAVQAVMTFQVIYQCEWC